MKITIDGDIKPYYIQNLCLVFFPGAKFSEKEIITPTTTRAEVFVRERGGGVFARVVLSDNGESATAECFESNETDFMMIPTKQIAVGKAFFEAGKKLLKYTPQWGVLIGIRPGKVARDLLDKDYTRTDVKRILRNEMFVNPKKAALASEIAFREKQIIKNIGKDTCSVYVSIPFCPTRCVYCSFVSFTSKRLLDLIPSYLEKLCEEIDRTFHLIRQLGKKVLSVYIGGGTPTTLTAAQLQILLTKITTYVSPSDLLEFTLEAGRPDTITEEKLRVAKSFGVTRISINPQTLDDEVLEEIGRKHTVTDFYHAYDIALNSGIEHINTDLIAGLPGDRFVGFSKSVDKIMELHPDNVTLHTFCVKKAADILREESSARVYSRTGGDVGKMIDYTHVCAKNNDYVPYYIYRQRNTVGNFENVGFSTEGTEGLYNILMMEEVHSVFSCGAGAVTKLVSNDRKHIKRIFSPKYPYEYLGENGKSTMDEESMIMISNFYETYNQ